MKPLCDIAKRLHLFAAAYARCDSIRPRMITLEPPRGIAADADPWRTLDLSRAGLSRFLRLAQTLVGLRGSVDVLLAGDRTLRRLNRDFRNKDKATDVLSFPTPAEIAKEFAGDLAISLDTARRQAEAHGHSLRDEVRVLLLHGLLHLNGMDHETDRGEMASREAALRTRLRLPNSLIARVESNVKKTVAKKKAAKALRGRSKAKVSA